MKDLLIYVAKALVSEPDAVSVTETENGDDVLLELRVAPDDMGKVIGRHGRIAKELRALLKAAGLRNGKRVTVEIID